MVYRIHFEPKGGYWCIQFQRGFLLWETVKTGESQTEVLKFPNLKEAEAYAADTGIAQAYQRSCYTRTAVASVMAGGASAH